MSEKPQDGVVDRNARARAVRTSSSPMAVSSPPVRRRTRHSPSWRWRCARPTTFHRRWARGTRNTAGNVAVGQQAARTACCPFLRHPFIFCCGTAAYGRPPVADKASIGQPYVRNRRDFLPPQADCGRSPRAGYGQPAPSRSGRAAPLDQAGQALGPRPCAAQHHRSRNRGISRSPARTKEPTSS